MPVCDGSEQKWTHMGVRVSHFESQRREAALIAEGSRMGPGQRRKSPPRCKGHEGASPPGNKSRVERSSDCWCPHTLPVESNPAH